MADSGSGARDRRSRAPPVDFKEMPLPGGIYRSEYPVEVPDKFQPGTSSLRYTAVTTNWDDFATPTNASRKPYALRQQESGMTTKMMIVVTMYNEEVDLFVATMHNIYRNIEFMVDKQGETKINWDNIVVCIICDGRQKCPIEVKYALELLGCYQADEFIMTDFLEQPVQAHLFEHLSGSHVRLADKKRKEIRLAPSRYPTQYLVCMKENNRKKIDSHGWAFRAFAPLLNPDVVVLFDMGTKPEPAALYHIWMHFKEDPQLGGACGEIKVRVEGATQIEKAGRLFINPLLAAQNFEYKMSNILAKSFQSCFGYITVLPGAFSAYRFAALEGRPLNEYFRREKPPSEEGENMSTWEAMTTANKYLAEDRILAFEIFTKADDMWTLRYVKEAKANTDAPGELGIYFNQRRRWLNGSMFAYLSALFNITQVHQSAHSSMTKIGFYFEMIYLFIELLFSLLAPMNYYCILVIMWSMFSTSLGITSSITFLIIAIYALTFFFGMLIFVGNNPKGSASQWVYGVMSFIWGVTVVAVLFLVGYNGGATFREAVASPSFATIGKGLLYVLALLCSYGLYLGASLVFKDVAHIFTSMVGYLLFAPSSVNMVLPFALANVHDVSWGNRPEEAASGGRALPQNKMKDGKAVVAGLLMADSHQLEVDLDKLEKELNERIDPDKERKEKEKAMPRKERLEARRKRRMANIEDRNKNVRMVLLLFFLSANLLGAVLVTNFSVYGILTATVSAGVDEKEAEAKRQASQTFTLYYTSIIFASIVMFSLLQFIGCVLFVMKTPKYRPGVPEAVSRIADIKEV
ncbi:chitin synthase-domain-containing protein [Cladochytrium replicatum]|nr:chitin synthase-domain-containing protein [Cladochytrium replicatum]